MHWSRFDGSALIFSLLLACGSSAPGSAPSAAAGQGGAGGGTISGGGSFSSGGVGPSGGAGAGGSSGSVGGGAGASGTGSSGAETGGSGGTSNGGAAGTAGNGGASQRTAVEIVGAMGLGWNLGNTLEALNVSDETGWGNPKTTQQIIDTVKDAGFESLRLPTSWDDHFSGSEYTIAPEWLDRVEEVANYGLSAGMHVIINVHHTKGWLSTSALDEVDARDHLTKLWAQIATHFAEYGDHLIFETMNEPRSGEDWTGKQEYFDVVNRLNAAALQTIRATGGNNRTRLVMLPGYCASPHPTQIDAFVLPPDDPMLAVSTHAYVPFSFALDSKGTASFTDGDKAGIDQLFAHLKDLFISKGVPVVMGEWASTNKGNLDDRVRHARYYVKAAEQAGFPVFWWDNGNFTPNSGDAMGLLDRKTRSFEFPEIVSAIVEQ